MLCRAKVNLTLHVGATIVGGRWDGYHPVESLVAFADFGDTLEFEPGDAHTLDIAGPFARTLGPGTSDNLVFRVLDRLGVPPQHVTLTKTIPVSAGLGGGSANAAAVLRRFDPDGRVDGAAFGADVPVCRLSQTAMMEGVGERLTPIPGLGSVPAVLVNPGVAVSTAAVFETFDSLPRAAEPARTDREGTLVARAYSGENDLYLPAISHAPVIAEVIDAINAQEGCDLARMSGSGATCFGLFQTTEAAQRAERMLQRDGWWVRACRIGDPD